MKDNQGTAMRDCFRKAAEYISEHGHYKGDYFKPEWSGLKPSLISIDDSPLRPPALDDDGLTPPACAMGALHKVDSSGWASFAAITALSNRLGCGVSSWNDDPATTAEDVILELKRAADEYRSPVEKVADAVMAEARKVPTFERGYINAMQGG
ncbi:DUF6197 family protein [Streptomyces microflavus]|uniref:DUF6197 family protein n=1 Tax=Streptomyces microflavus TaxID=1919 RepID=UPI00369E149D